MASPPQLARMIDQRRTAQYELTTTKLSIPQDKLPQINLYFSGNLTVSLWLQSNISNPAELERVSVVSYPNPVQTRVLGVTLDQLSSLRDAIQGTLRRDFPAILFDEEGRDEEALVECVLENVREINIIRPHMDVSLYFRVDVEIDRLFSCLTDDDDDDDDGCDGMVPALESAVEALERVSSDKMGCCAICLEEEEEYSRDCEVLSMPCCHVFHGRCIRKWLKVNHCCPMCRFQMPPAT